jgi:hypothetical protein
MKQLYKSWKSPFSGLQKIAEGGRTLASLFQGDNSKRFKPVVQKLTEQLTGSLEKNLVLNADAASGVAGSLIPKI